MSRVPSPADWRRKMEFAKAANGTKPIRAEIEPAPWLAALDAIHAQTMRELERANAEVVRLRVERDLMTRRLREARHRLENWKLRQAEWHRERDRLAAVIRELRAGVWDGN